MKYKICPLSKLCHLLRQGHGSGSTEWLTSTNLRPGKPTIRKQVITTGAKNDDFFESVRKSTTENPDLSKSTDGMILAQSWWGCGEQQQADLTQAKLYLAHSRSLFQRETHSFRSHSPYQSGD